MKRFFSKRVLLVTFLGLLVAGGIVLGCDQYIERAFSDRLYRHLDQVPKRPVALLLGTSKKARSGRDNLFYMPRIRAAADLYKAGRVDGILVSGDNSRATYDEPTQMKADLVALGVAAEQITLDYAGFRTLDSVVRAEEVFGQSAYVVVSQPFHCQRTLFIAAARGHDAVAYCAADVAGPWGVKVRLREVLARSKAFLDVYVTGKEPKFLGEKVAVNTR